tara:strand:- start:8934 stop:9350 length:417 start_codon:yes stop_codon:yes gene_type:complete
MAAGRYNFKIEQGSTVDFTINYKDSENSPINLHGYEARMMIKSQDRKITYATLSSSVQADGSGIDLNPPDAFGNTLPKESGSLRLYISAATSSAFDFTTALYDLEIYSSSFNSAAGQNVELVTKVLTGGIGLIKEVTT